MKNCSPSRDTRRPVRRTLHNKCVLFFPSIPHRPASYLSSPVRPMPISFSLNAILYNTAKFPLRTPFLRNCSATTATYLPHVCSSRSLLFHKPSICVKVVIRFVDKCNLNLWSAIFIYLFSYTNYIVLSIFFNHNMLGIRVYVCCNFLYVK